ncbi:MAG: hypothetical protein ACQEQE_02590 [Bacillota bacterium]
MINEFNINDETFRIKNYQKKDTFSSFLPGIAGKFGIPMWAFYVNRGQGIASFGIESKDNPLMEFFPANKSYENVETKGFRTFIKIDGKVYEPFIELNEKITSEMKISSECLEITEINKNLDIETNVKYYILPNENFGGFVRKLSVKNLNKDKKTISVLDGMPKIIPFGIDNDTLKKLSQTVSAWINVKHLDKKMPFFTLSASSEDEAQVDEIHAGNFYISTYNNKLNEPIIDPGKVFDYDKSFKKPICFIENEEIDLNNQKKENQFPCAMSNVKNLLSHNEEIQINSIFGHIKDESILPKVKEKVLQPNFFKNKKIKSKKIHKAYSDLCFTHSGDSRFNGYVKQNFLDNILRGGIPISIGKDNKKTYHIFSRKHGDLERDYNKFSLEPNYFSQGNGNFRDVNQNRRNDIFFNKEVKDHNIKTFFDLISLEGFNPLVINGQKFILKDDIKDLNLNNKILDLITKPYSVGKLYSLLKEEGFEEKFEKIIDKSESILESDFDEGYWVDHWTYNLDLIESYLRIYPDKLKELFLRKDYKFYDSYVYVLPRDEKYYLTDRGIRQYNSLKEDLDKKEKIKNELNGSFKKVNGKVLKASLIEKMTILLINKIASLDPSGIGIEMEANKPGWYDALNGLPGIFGSSFGETAEVYKWTKFLKDTIDKLEFKNILVIDIFKEFFNKIKQNLITWSHKKDDFLYWDLSNSAKEVYRKKSFENLEDSFSEISKKELIKTLDLILEKLESSIKKARKEDGLFTMFYSHKAVDFEKTGKIKDNMELVTVSKFEKNPLGNFLEGQVKALKVLDNDKALKELHKSVKSSELFDKKLDMYRVNGTLENESFEIGRAKAFSPGWLENGSIWLHMEYKYLLELLKNGLYKEYIDAFNKAGICYQPPERYKRSTFENSSFILSSLNSDSKNHGRGYIARLSGATAEFIDMWTILSFGKKPFNYENNELVFKPNPVLTKKLFTESESKASINFDELNYKQFSLPKNTYTARFLGQTLIVYHNENRKDTFGPNACQINKYILTYKNGTKVNVNKPILKGEDAKDLRKGLITKLDIILK